MNSEDFIPSVLDALTRQKVHKIPPFAKPHPNYFLNLSQIILSTAIENSQQELTAFPLLDSISKKTPFYVPDNYFKEQVSLVKPISSPYSMPSGYLANLDKKVIQNARSKKIGTFVILTSKLLKITAAAIIVLLIGLFIVQKSNISTTFFYNEKGDEITAVQKIEDNDLSDFIDEDNNDKTAKKENNNADLFKNINTADLQYFITETEEN